MTKEERTKRVSTIRGYHDEVFEYLGITEAYFYPRYLVKRNGIDCSLI